MQKGGRRQSLLRNLVRWLADECLDKCGYSEDLSDWQLVATPPGVPLQDNACDCGVFVVM